MGQFRAKPAQRHRPLQTSRDSANLVRSDDQAPRSAIPVVSVPDKQRAGGGGHWVAPLFQNSDTPPGPIVLNDGGKEAGADAVFQRFSQGEQVVALDLMFMGAAWKDEHPFLFAQMLDGLGDRPIGLAADQP